DTHLGKGDEIADYTVSFSTDNAKTKSVSINYYEGDKRASQLTASETDAMLIRTDGFRKKLAASDTTVLLADFDRSKTQTFFDTHLGKGDEIADYTVSFSTDNAKTKSVSI